MRGLAYSNQSLADLDAILTYISRDKPRAAENLLDRITKTCERLAQFPQMGTRRDNLGHGIFSFSVSSYVIFYRHRGDRIEIARVMHGSQDAQAFFNE